ncbi:hypothetical protein [Alkalihalobacterium chitinilyticum]|uniref:Uncharacterized protein n=1 Tax=Alkalihalobacterium chitinilyticum TaxID=2980103 RepID=A0ABT5VFJ0_9BACI|nr:hypothetical protein [Alkalihalobacterium chitinilyticum]MDE5414216.1 hypothetical protein [Alkalihalobacterium chitinilyticum]
MSMKAFHIYNILILLLLLTFNALALFGAGMSEGGIYPYMWFITGVSFASWVFFYIIQFVRPNKVWRISWFLIMVIILFLWETGLGSKVGLMIFN